MSDNLCNVSCTLMMGNFWNSAHEKKESYSPYINIEGKHIRFCVDNAGTCYFTIYLQIVPDYFFPLEKKIKCCITLPIYNRPAFSLSRIIPSGIDMKNFRVAILSLQDMQNYVVNNTLKIVCEIVEVQEHAQIFVYEPFMNNKTLSDVKLFVGDVEFLSHKLVLCAHSTVFEKMFSHEMKESINNEVEIKEMSSEIFQELLRYMYTGKVNNLKENARDILIAASFYQIKGLILMCSDFFRKNITKNNVTDILKLADDHNASTLKDYCFDFIIEHYGDFVNSEAYKNLKKTRADLIVEVATKIGLEYKVTM